MDEILLGDRELDVMEVLWERGSGTVAEVRERLPADLAYTTVLTILRNLEDKGAVGHDAEGRAHRYFPRVARREAERRAIMRVVDKLFGGSAEELLVHLVEERELSARALARIQERIRRGALDHQADGSKGRRPGGRGKR